MFSSRFMLFPTLKKIGVKQNSGGRGGCPGGGTPDLLWLGGGGGCHRT